VFARVVGKDAGDDQAVVNSLDAEADIVPILTLVFGVPGADDPLDLLDWLELLLLAGESDERGLRLLQLGCGEAVAALGVDISI